MRLGMLFAGMDALLLSHPGPPPGVMTPGRSRLAGDPRSASPFFNDFMSRPKVLTVDDRKALERAEAKRRRKLERKPATLAVSR